MSKPTIGRIVHFVESGRSFAAIITGVNEGSIDVTVFPPAGHHPYGKINIEPSEDGADGWTWPPRDDAPVRQTSEALTAAAVQLGASAGVIVKDGEGLGGTNGVQNSGSVDVAADKKKKG